MKVSKLLRQIFTQPKGGINAKAKLNIEGEAVIRDKDGNIKQRVKMKKRRFFG